MCFLSEFFIRSPTFPAWRWEIIIGAIGDSIDIINQYNLQPSEYRQGLFIIY